MGPGSVIASPRLLESPYESNADKSALAQIQTDMSRFQVVPPVAADTVLPLRRYPMRMGHVRECQLRSSQAYKQVYSDLPFTIHLDITHAFLPIFTPETTCNVPPTAVPTRHRVPKRRYGCPHALKPEAIPAGSVLQAILVDGRTQPPNPHPARRKRCCWASRSIKMAEATLANDCRANPEWPAQLRYECLLPCKTTSR